MPTTLDQQIGQRLRQLRKWRGLSQRRLAKRVNASLGVVNHLEHGRNALTAARIIALARVLDVPPAALFTLPGAALRRESVRDHRRIPGEVRVH